CESPKYHQIIGTKTGCIFKRINVSIDVPGRSVDMPSPKLDETVIRIETRRFVRKLERLGAMPPVGGHQTKLNMRESRILIVEECRSGFPLGRDEQFFIAPVYPEGVIMNGR